MMVLASQQQEQECGDGTNFVLIFIGALLSEAEELIRMVNPMFHAVIAVNLYHFNPFKPEFTIVIFIHYKPRIAVAILDVDEMIWSEWKIKENYHVLVNQFYGKFYSKIFGCRKLSLCFNASWGLNGLS